MTWLFLAWLRGRLQAFAGVAMRYPMQCALVALLCLSAWLWRGKEHALAERDEARAEIIAQADKFKAAQEAARAQALAEREALTATYKELADAADLRLAKAKGSAAAYAATHRVRFGKDCGGATQPSGLPSPSPDDNGPGDAADMVAISREDFDKLTDAALRAAANNAWGQSLVNEGLAVPRYIAPDIPEPAFGGQ